MNDETNVSSLPRGKNSTWYWLKSSSGRNNIHTIAIKQEEEESSSSSAAAAAIPDEIASMANRSDDDDDHHENRKRKRELRNLAPHNNVGTTEAFPMPPKRARKPPTLFINYAGSGDRGGSSTSTQHEDEDLRGVAVPDSIPSSLPSDLVEWEKRRAANPPEPVGWYWHLNPDGSPVVVDAAGRKRLSQRRNEKRNRVGQKTKRRPGPSSTQLPANEGSRDLNRFAKRPRLSTNESTQEANATVRRDGARNAIKRENESPPVASSNKTRRSSRRVAIVNYRENGGEEEESIDSNGDESAFGDDDEAVVDEEEALQACQGGVSGSKRGCHGRYAKDPKRWENQFQLLIEYKNKHGNTNVPQPKYPNKHGNTNIPQGDRTLGNWVVEQRKAYRKNKLSQHRQGKLESIDFEWCPNRNQKCWEEQFKLLVEYKNKHGNTNVPASDRTLGDWVNWQRHRYKQKKLLQDRVERLNSIDFDWQPNKNLPTWIDMYNQLLSYQREHNGSTTVSKACTENKKLAQWVQHQRANYSKSKISQERINLLENIDFEWDPREELWMKMYRRLREYKNKYGSSRVPHGCREDPKLATWVGTQRANYSKSKLSDERIKLLENIGFQWDPLHAQWMEMYQRLVTYKEKYGNTLVPFEWKKDPKLAFWVTNQRTNYSKSKLSQKRIDVLEAVGFQWDARSRWV